MRRYQTIGAAIAGIQGILIPIEVTISEGRPGFVLSGLHEAAANATRERVRAAFINSGLPWPEGAVTVSLRRRLDWPANTALDLPIAAAIVMASGIAGPTQLQLLIGELGLDGTVRPVRGIVPMLLAAAKLGHRQAIVPQGNLTEFSFVAGVRVAGASTLYEAIAALSSPATVEYACAAESSTAVAKDVSFPDAALCDVLSVAAAGGHHLALIGSRSTSASRAANLLHALLPNLETEAALEVAALYSLAGRPRSGSDFPRPPLQALHHTMSTTALVGGGRGVVRPGALSLAHRGVLVLNEADEFPRRSVDAITACVHDGSITLARACGTVTLPAVSQVVLSAHSVPRHLDRLVDRIDIRVGDSVGLPNRFLAAGAQGPALALLQAKARSARTAAAGRWGTFGFANNAAVPHDVLNERPWRLPAARTADLDQAVKLGTVSTRAHTRVLRLAWTLADLAGRSSPTAEDIQTAIHLNTGATHERHQ